MKKLQLFPVSKYGLSIHGPLGSYVTTHRESCKNSHMFPGQQVQRAGFHAL